MPPTKLKVWDSTGKEQVVAPGRGLAHLGGDQRRRQAAVVRQFHGQALGLARGRQGDRFGPGGKVDQHACEAWLTTTLRSSRARICANKGTVNQAPQERGTGIDGVADHGR